MAPRELAVLRRNFDGRNDYQDGPTGALGARARAELTTFFLRRHSLLYLAVPSILLFIFVSLNWHFSKLSFFPSTLSSNVSLSHK